MDILFAECFCAVTATDIQRKIALGTGKKRKVPPEERLSVERVADRFNQVTEDSFACSAILPDWFKLIVIDESCDLLSVRKPVD